MPAFPSFVLTCVESIIPASGGFLAKKNDGSFIYWGNTVTAEDNPFTDGDLLQVGEMKALEGAVKVVFGRGETYAALMPDGGVVSGGSYPGFHKSLSGFISYDDVQDELYDVTDIYASPFSFGALRADGAFITWGSGVGGGDSGEFHKELNR